MAHPDTHRNVILAVGTALGMIFLPLLHADEAHALPTCTYEDGNPDGMPCLWSDPDTGATYYVDSTNYQESAR